jgi:CRISPR-associated protein Csc1
LNELGLYVTPARGINVHYELVTFKYADNAYRVKMTPGRYNTPTYGRAKEVATGSQFEFAVLSDEAVRLPRWIRMGLWGSKALVQVLDESETDPIGYSEQVADLPLNPLDVPGDLQVYDLISMPPSSLIENARVAGEWIQAEVADRKIRLPAGMRYTFPER